MIDRGVQFGEIHSFNDLNLILAPFVPMPAIPKTTYIDIPGGDGDLDLTEVHGEVKFQNRDFTFTFSVNPDSLLSFDDKVTQVSNALNGKRCKITLDRDPDYYWDGRITIDQYLQDRNLKQIVVKANVKPYKLKQNVTAVSYALTSAEKSVTLTNGRKSVVPEITCTNSNTVVSFGSVTKTLNAGTHKVLDFQLKEGNNVFKLSGSGTIMFKYQEGEL